MPGQVAECPDDLGHLVDHGPVCLPWVFRRSLLCDQANFCDLGNAIDGDALVAVRLVGAGEPRVSLVEIGHAADFDVRQVRALKAQEAAFCR